MSKLLPERNLHSPAGRFARMAGLAVTPPARPIMENLIKGFVDLVIQPVCLACNKPLQQITIHDCVCLDCWSGIKMNLPPFCRRCGRTLNKDLFSKNICCECQRVPVHFDRAFSVCRYDGTAKNLIHQFKYNGKERLGSVFGKLLAGFIKEYDVPITAIDGIIPVPLHPSKLREREYNQAEILAAAVSRDFDKPLITRALVRNRPTITQTELPQEQRQNNVLGCFNVAAKEAVREKNILIVDDVLTTGATASEAARTLKSAGSAVIFVLTIAS